MKKKLALNVEELRIEQFQVEPAVAETRGTVRGFWSDLNCDTYTCDCGSMGASDPCRYCVEMPITHSCDHSCPC